VSVRCYPYLRVTRGAKQAEQEGRKVEEESLDEAARAVAAAGGRTLRYSKISVIGQGRAGNVNRSL
jgi:hypothetical protein